MDHHSFHRRGSVIAPGAGGSGRATNTGAQALGPLHRATSGPLRHVRQGARRSRRRGTVRAAPGARSARTRVGPAEASRAARALVGRAGGAGRPPLVPRKIMLRDHAHACARLASIPPLTWENGTLRRCQGYPDSHGESLPLETSPSCRLDAAGRPPRRRCNGSGRDAAGSGGAGLVRVAGSRRRPRRSSTLGPRRRGRIGTPARSHVAGDRRRARGLSPDRSRTIRPSGS